MSNATQTVELELREYAKAHAGSRAGRTIGALRRTDRDRLPQFWDGSAVVDRQAIQNLYDGDEEKTVFFAVERFHELRAAIGFVMVEGYGPMSAAWLVVNGAAVIDVARNGRDLTGLLGLELRTVEASLWTPTNRAEVANVRGVAGFTV
jgi:hypothetical protein